MLFSQVRYASILLVLSLSACSLPSPRQQAAVDWDHLNYAEIACHGPCKSNKADDELSAISKSGKSSSR